MKLIHKIKLFIAKKRGDVAKTKPVEENWQLPELLPKPEINLPKPALKQPDNSSLTLKEFIVNRKLLLESQITLVKDRQTKLIMDEEYQQLEKIEEAFLWQKIKD